MGWPRSPFWQPTSVASISAVQRKAHTDRSLKTITISESCVMSAPAVATPRYARRSVRARANTGRSERGGLARGGCLVGSVLERGRIFCRREKMHAEHERERDHEQQYRSEERRVGKEGR